MRILIADDHDVVRQGLCTLLAANHVICAQASDGTEAIEKTREFKPDAVIMDVRMPKLDGLSATREIKKFSPELPVVVLSMYNGPVVEQAKSAGAKAYVSKATASMDLPRALDAVLRCHLFFPPYPESND